MLLLRTALLFAARTWVGKASGKPDKEEERLRDIPEMDRCGDKAKRYQREQPTSRKVSDQGASIFDAADIDCIDQRHQGGDENEYRRDSGAHRCYQPKGVDRT